MADKEYTDAIALLKADHREVEDLFEKYENASGTERKRKLAEQICNELKIHTVIEEEIFYPAFRDAARNAGDREMFFEAVEEHKAAGDLVLPHLQATEVTSDQFGGRAKVLKELVEHHADEEEKEMFKRARELMGREQLEDLGMRMEQRKVELGG